MCDSVIRSGKGTGALTVGKLAFYFIIVLGCVLIHKILVDIMGLENWVFLMVGVLLFWWGFAWGVKDSNRKRKGNKP